MNNNRLSKFTVATLLVPLCVFVFIRCAAADGAGDDFSKAKEFTYAEKWGDAINHFKDFLERHSDSDMVDDAAFWLGFSYIKNGENDCGITVMNSFFADDPSFMLDSDSSLACKDEKLKARLKSLSTLPPSESTILKGSNCGKVMLTYVEKGQSDTVVSSYDKNVKLDVQKAQGEQYAKLAVLAYDKNIKLDCDRIVMEKVKMREGNTISGSKVTVTGSDCDKIMYKYDGTARMTGTGAGIIWNNCVREKDETTGKYLSSGTKSTDEDMNCEATLTLQCETFSSGLDYGSQTLELLESKYADDALYYKGIAYMNKKDYTSGIEVFKRLTKSFEGSMWVPEALIRARDYFVETGDYESVLSVYKTFMKKFPSDYRIEDIKTGYCVALQKLGRAGECAAFLEKLKKKKDSYSDSVSAEIMRIHKDNGGPGESGAPAFIMPVCGKSYFIDSPFGTRKRPTRGQASNHRGLDLKSMDPADPFFKVCAAAEGEVVFAGWKGGYGNTIIIRHNGEFSTVYAHASKLLVKTGQMVSKGEQIMLAGSTGVSVGNHLHFEVRRNGIAVNPMDYIKK